MAPTDTTIAQRESAFLLNQLALCTNSLNIKCNDGEVQINANDFNFTYIGKFGQLCSNLIIKKGFCNDLVNKFFVVGCFIDLYSKNNGGFTIEVN